MSHVEYDSYRWGAGNWCRSSPRQFEGAALWSLQRLGRKGLSGLAVLRKRGSKPLEEEVRHSPAWLAATTGCMLFLKLLFQIEIDLVIAIIYYNI